MTNPTEIIPGVIFYSYLATSRKDKVGFLQHHTLVLQVSGHFKLETAGQTVTMNGGQMLLIRKNQLGQITKTPLPDQDYETIVISLQEDLLRQIALEEHIDIDQKYIGPPNILIPANEFLAGYFNSIVPYIRNSSSILTTEMGLIKIKEVVKLLMHTMPRLKEFLFDFSEPYKIDLEKFMLGNIHFNLPVEKFAQLTGRSLAAFKRDFQKTFGQPPRQWLQERRLTEARHLIEAKHRKPSAIYLDLGFESLSHFSHTFKKRFGKTPSEFIGVNINAPIGKLAT
ncbi:AraC family transcriptional regulator [Mucilaginibacter myungsuensis]|uniref:Helix-turn-helix transcriptional regulator n=1 Tax=Mucilaginibacter myungsuensis TaxID=649104 RepID=A0A929KS36_9SPHI|nr:AraC family transcriptional regulator [Mucilaginibacter myungsuensis]MBE9660474.1 helix-turn-helix transcriptional regulator [Mucilaginibacter myungsuensis]MDN3600518.1 AraC family transcriptional regulator [Mucilaginibacter myungsuensis]